MIEREWKSTKDLTPEWYQEQEDQGDDAEIYLTAGFFGNVHQARAGRINDKCGWHAKLPPFVFMERQTHYCEIPPFGDEIVEEMKRLCKEHYDKERNEREKKT